MLRTMINDDAGRCLQVSEPHVCSASLASCAFVLQMLFETICFIRHRHCIAHRFTAAAFACELRHGPERCMVLLLVLPVFFEAGAPTDIWHCIGTTSHHRLRSGPAQRNICSATPLGEWCCLCLGLCGNLVQLDILCCMLCNKPRAYVEIAVLRPEGNHSGYTPIGCAPDSPQLLVILFCLGR